MFCQKPLFWPYVPWMGLDLTSRAAGKGSGQWEAGWTSMEDSIVHMGASRYYVDFARFGKSHGEK